ncbi:MAG: class I SAM-dependent methyltransferase [Phototrophicaceae bacterium]
MSFQFSLDDLHFLMSDRGQHLLTECQELPHGDMALTSWLSKKRGMYSPQQTASVLETTQLRRIGVRKWGEIASQLFFTRDALEQASDPLVRAYRANLITSRRVIDACCGIGTDAIAFAQMGIQVQAMDVDPLRLAMARHNAHILGCQVEFVEADVTAGIFDNEVVFFDPARRDEWGARIFHVEHYIPPLSTIRKWQHATHIYVKLSPGVELEQLSSYAGELHFISVEGELKEALLSYDPTQTTLQRVAVRLSTQHPPMKFVSMETFHDSPLTPPLNWIHEPDPSILRAGYVQHLARQIGATMLDPTIAYLTSAHAVQSAWIRSWRVLEWMPFNLKHLKQRLRERGVGQVTIKKRGHPMTPEALQAKLKLKGDVTLTLFLTKVNDIPAVILCEDQQVS